ncbi:MAG: hypothetical protein RIT27_1128 [Pseudomonadota bacterium]
MNQDYYLLLGIPHDTVKPEVIRVAAETRLNEFREAFERLQQCAGRAESGDAYDYAILEVSPAASLVEIKESVQRKSAAIKEASQTLIDPTKRVLYDQSLKTESSLNDVPMILRQSTQKHPPSLRKHATQIPIPTPISSPLIKEKSSHSSLSWLWLFVTVGLVAIGIFSMLRFLK